MEEEKKLYPFKFCTVEDRYCWGSEEFDVADLGYRDTFVRDGWLAANALSEVMEMYMDRVTGENAFEIYGRQFPVQVKHIRCRGRMPLRVHPDDETAAQRYDALGREKFWYVLKAQKEARLLIGFEAEMDAESLCEACADGSIGGKMRAVEAKAGDCFRIAPGTVHGATGNVDILEVSEASALDFCIYAWGQALGEEEFDPEMSIVDALDFIRYTPSEDFEDTSIREFTVNRIPLKSKLEISTGDSFLIYVCLSGEAQLQVGESGIGALSYRIAQGETMLVPNDCRDFTLEPVGKEASLLEILVEKRPFADPYLNEK
ncbi:MAG: hypothetical protein MJY43_02205 [Bacteroidales bacterium]|nr:hypothetical protein [Bacteroidales bacterium]